jgi:hypothetical protein
VDALMVINYVNAYVFGEGEGASNAGDAQLDSLLLDLANWTIKRSAS